MRAILAYHDTHMRLFVYNGVVTMTTGVSKDEVDATE